MKLVMTKDGYRKVGDKYLLARKCSTCGRWLVASTDNFYKHKNGKYGLEARCKECAKNQNKRYREANKEKIHEQQKQYRENNKEKEAERNKRWYEANKEKKAEYGKRYREANKEKVSELHKRYRENNKEKIAERRKRYYEANKDKELERDKQYYEANKDKIAEQSKQYRQSPQGQVVKFNRNQRRRIKEEQQGSGITKDQWLEMMSFFNFRCAYSGETLSKNTRSIDHIVPIDVGGDHMIWNCVPMTRSLNSSKQAKDMLEWYKEQECYDPKRLQKIYEWQEYAYNKWGKDSEYFNSGNIQIKLI